MLFGKGLLYTVPLSPTSHRIPYLKNILDKNNGKLIKRVYIAQRDNPTKGDFIELVKKDQAYIGMPFDETLIGSKYKIHLNDM